MFGLIDDENAMSLPSFLECVDIPESVFQLRKRWYGLLENELRTYTIRQIYPMDLDVEKIVDQVRGSMAVGSEACFAPSSERGAGLALGSVVASCGSSVFIAI
jgi:hypothetical protein